MQWTREGADVSMPISWVAELAFKCERRGLPLEAAWLSALSRPSTGPAMVENDSGSQSTLTADALAAQTCMSRTLATGASVFSSSYPTSSRGEVRSSGVA